MTLPENFYERLYDKAEKRLQYQGASGDEFSAWSKQVRDKLRELLDLQDVRETPEAEVVSREECDGFVREKVIIKNGVVDEIPAYLLIPEAIAEPVSGVICLHGHGGYFAGKDMVAGVTDTKPIAIECAEALNYGYGVQLAQAGFATICPDAFGFGERLLESDRWAEEHVCDRYSVGLAAYGLTPMGITASGNMQVIDYLLSRPEVRSDGAGCVGLSFGGWQSYVTTCVDERIVAGVVSGALSCYGTSPGPRCGAQMVPGMLKWFNQIDMQKAIAPRPVLYEIMLQDTSFEYDKSMAQYVELKSFYESLGIGDRIELDTADTDHRYIGNKVEAFFKKHLV